MSELVGICRALNRVLPTHACVHLVLMGQQVLLRVTHRLELLVEDLASAAFHHFVHQLHQVGALVRFLVLLGEVLNGVVDEILQVLGRILTIMEEL